MTTDLNSGIYVACIVLIENVICFLQLQYQLYFGRCMIFVRTMTNRSTRKSSSASCHSANWIRLCSRPFGTYQAQRRVSRGPVCTKLWHLLRGHNRERLYRKSFLRILPERVRNSVHFFHCTACDITQSKSLLLQMSTNLASLITIVINKTIGSVYTLKSMT